MEDKVIPQTNVPAPDITTIIPNLLATIFHHSLQQINVGLWTMERLIIWHLNWKTWEFIWNTLKLMKQPSQMVKAYYSNVGSNHISLNSHNFLLDNILHVLNSSTNLLSVHQFSISNDISLEFFSNFFVIKDFRTKQLLHRGWVKDDFYS